MTAKPTLPYAAAAVLEFTLPVLVVSEMNARDSWRGRHKRFASHREAVDALLAPTPALLKGVGQMLSVGGKAVITLTRCGGRSLDSDNLAGGFKAVRDRLAEKLDLDDGDPRLTWEYDQVTGGPAGTHVQIRVEPPKPC